MKVLIPFETLDGSLGPIFAALVRFGPQMHPPIAPEVVQKTYKNSSKNKPQKYKRNTFWAQRWIPGWCEKAEPRHGDFTLGFKIYSFV